VIGVLGILEDASRVLKMGFRQAGDFIVLLDGTAATVGARYILPLQDAAREFSCSEYSKTIGGIMAGEPPNIDLVAEKRLIDCLVALAANSLVQSAHDISDGGLAVTLAESCFASVGVQLYPERSRGNAAPQLGAIVNLEEDSGPAEYALFGERGGRAIVSVSPTMLARVLETARQYSVVTHRIGQVVSDGAFRIQYRGDMVIDSPVGTLHDIWAHSVERTLKVR
jgi:phosphoribosylformylglycinamidine synthase subunit PurL